MLHHGRRAATPLVVVNISRVLADLLGPAACWTLRGSIVSSWSMWMRARGAHLHASSARQDTFRRVHRRTVNRALQVACTSLVHHHRVLGLPALELRDADSSRGGTMHPQARLVPSSTDQNAAYRALQGLFRHSTDHRTAGPAVTRPPCPSSIAQLGTKKGRLGEAVGGGVVSRRPGGMPRERHPAHASG